jgi:hypothetical protein
LTTIAMDLKVIREMSVQMKHSSQVVSSQTGRFGQKCRL